MSEYGGNSKMKLNRACERIWYSMYEEERDRPCLGYILGDRWSLAVDAGHSDAHVEEFYEALEQAGLPLPSVTVLTHWHWDHSFGMHAIHGISIANEATARHLEDFSARVRADGGREFLSLDPSIRKEYANNRPVVITAPDVVFEKRLDLDPGNIKAVLLRSVSPHTDDALLVYIPEDKVLFVGDAQLGEFPSWRMDYDRLYALGKKIRETSGQKRTRTSWLCLKSGSLGRNFFYSLCRGRAFYAFFFKRIL